MEKENKPEIEGKPEKKKSKWRLNLFDIIFISCILAIAGIIIGYVGFSSGFLFSSGSRETVTYTIELQGMLFDSAFLPKPGDELIDRVEKRPLGTIVSAEVKPSLSIQKNLSTGELILTEISDRYDAIIVVSANANVTDNQVRIGRFTIRVGTWLSVNGPLYTGSGFIIDMERSDAT